METVSTSGMTEVQKDFLKHLQDSERVIFSAPFGVGKTYFLKEFFDQPQVQEKCEVFTIHPVNYCTADNKDIFELIKFDIINQLVEKGYLSNQLDKGESPKKNDKRIFNLLCEGINIVTLGKSKGVADSVVSAYKIISALKNSNKEILNTKKNKALKFKKGLGDESGLYVEMNMISQFVKDKIEEVNEKKTTILVIEDLDRLDPAHMFRLLNIFSAHDDCESGKNKFGFSKVMFVCDLDNVKKIYKHFYGPDTDFEGYLNKFYDAWPFEFGNFQAIANYVTGKLRFYLEKRGYKVHYELFSGILIQLALENKISFREVLKLEKINLNEIIFDKRCEWRFTELLHLPEEETGQFKIYGIEPLRNNYYALPSAIILLTKIFAVERNIKKIFADMKPLAFVNVSYDLKLHTIAAREFYMRSYPFEDKINCEIGVEQIDEHRFLICRTGEEKVDVKSVLAEIAGRAGIDKD